MATPINIPRRVNGRNQFAITAEWANSVVEAIQRLANQKQIRPIPGGSSGTQPPFWPTLKSSGGESPTYKVSLTDGWLNERIPGVYAGDPPPTATAFHKPHNILWGAEGSAQSPARLATDRREFPIAIGEQLSIVVYVDPDGAIGGDAAPADGPLEIAVETEDTPSVHYVPPRATDEYVGAAGVYHYKMAVLRAADATHTGPWLELFMAGSHLDHFRDLPLLENSAAEAENKGRVFKEYDEATNQYIFRTLDATAGELTITEQESGVEIRGNEVNGSLSITVGDASPSIVEWMDGLIKTAGTQSIQVPGPGWWGTCLFQHFAEAGDSDPYLQLKQTFENGILIGVEVQDPGDVLTAVTGTEAAPGTTQFASNGGNA